jgi:large subunit ribosomal protein L4
MAEITLKDRAGKDAGTVDLDDTVFGIEPNVPVMHQVVTAQLARRRAGTQSTKTRAEVRGGGAKPYRQKGTGRARQGSLRAPQFTGGGIALGPKPRSYAQRTPKKMIKLALRSALSDRASAGKVVVVDDWSFDAPKTKDAKAALAALGLEGRVLLVVDRADAAAALSFRNLPDVQLIAPGELNAYDVLCNDWIVFTSANLPSPDATREGGEAESSEASPDATREGGEAEPSSEASEASTESEPRGEAVAEGEASEASTESEPRGEAVAEGEASAASADATREGGEAEPSSEASAASADATREGGEAEPSSEASAASTESEES